MRSKINVGVQKIEKVVIVEISKRTTLLHKFCCISRSAVVLLTGIICTDSKEIIALFRAQEKQEKSNVKAITRFGN